MNFISTKGMTPDNAPKGKVLVQYLEPSWGGYTIEYAIAYFDNPNQVKEGEELPDGIGVGWKHAITGNKIKVLAYCLLPKPKETEVSELTQIQFKDKFGTSHPNFGCVGE